MKIHAFVVALSVLLSPEQVVRARQPEQLPRIERGKLTRQAEGLRHTLGRIYGVFVGISDYDGEDEDLDYTADDARRLRQDLVRGAGMRTEDAALLVDRGATLSAFRRAISDVARRAAVDDLVVIFFSGHGDRVERSTLQPADPDGFDETLTMFDGEMTDDEMNRLLGPVHGRVLLVLDSCYSGGFSKDVISAPRRMGLFSSEEDVVSSVADEFRAGGYLAKFMAEAIGDWRADVDGNDDITAIELSQYLHDRYQVDVNPAPGRRVRSKASDDDDVQHQRLVVDRGSVRPLDVVLRRDGAAMSVEAGRPGRATPHVDRLPSGVRSRK